jgi:hypothetical protein
MRNMGITCNMALLLTTIIMPTVLLVPFVPAVLNIVMITLDIDLRSRLVFASCSATSVSVYCLLSSLTLNYLLHQSSFCVRQLWIVSRSLRPRTKISFQVWMILSHHHQRYTESNITIPSRITIPTKAL